MKDLKNKNELIEIMKKNGIKFNVINEDDAKHFLSQHNYYFKLSAYRKNYEKKNYPDGGEKYISLDFAYLKELSTIDMHLRYMIIKMCLDIEHSLKIKLLELIENNPKEDGYNICRIFYTENNILEEIQKSKSSSYNTALIEKYCPANQCSPQIPIWAMVELISFGNLAFLYKTYDQVYRKSFPKVNLLFNVKNLRNAAAHSNCLINDLSQGGARPEGCIVQFVKNLDEFGMLMINTKLSNRVICDFVTMLFIYKEFVKSEDTKATRYRELQGLFNVRMIKNQEYFKDNECIKDSYLFCKKIIDKLVNTK